MNFTPANQFNPLNSRNLEDRSAAATCGFTLFLLSLATSLSLADNAFCQEKPVESTAAPVATDAKTADSAKVGNTSTGFTALRKHWENCVFGGDGAIEIRTDVPSGVQVEMMPGDPITGIRWTGDFPKENYELRMQGRRVDGFDFFAAITFPVGQEHCSFVLGGWGGGMVGVSSIDGMDASSNETTQYKEFENGRWYAIRIRVDEKRVRCWIDDQEYATVERADHTLSIRIEMDPCLPMGIASFMTRSELKNIELKKLDTGANATNVSPSEPTTPTK